MSNAHGQACPRMQLPQSAEEAGRCAEAARDPLEGCRLMLEYVELTRRHNTPLRMVKGHAFKMLGELAHAACTRCCRC